MATKVKTSSTLFTNANKEPIQFFLGRGEVRLEYQDAIEVIYDVVFHLMSTISCQHLCSLVQRAGGMLVDCRRDADIV